MNPDFLFNLSPGDVVYDIETYPNIFTIGLEHQSTGQRWLFEISHRRNDLELFCLFMEQLNTQGCNLVGFNNIGFDYPVIHFIYRNRHAHLSVKDIYTKAMSIINTPFNNRFSNIIWDEIVPQIDLFKIHHFDNQAKSTSLKMLEFNMRMDNIEDLPFDVGLELNNEQCDILISYMWHDIKATSDFYRESTDEINLRHSLTAQYGKNMINYNDTKIGSEIFIYELEQSGVACYEYVNGKRKPRQTPRDSIRLADIILPYIQFETEFQRILDWYKKQTIVETKGVFDNINATVNGLQYDFGTGGLHAAVNNQVFHSDDNYVVELRDVKSYYPNLAIKNNFFPEHLSRQFCIVYEKLYNERVSHPKGSAENAALKLALNGTYGNSNNQYSPFYDSQFTMSITVNGQLLLCLLVEKLLKASSLEIIAANTDGIAYRVARSQLGYVNQVCAWWESLTKLELETDHIDRYFSKDVNNYLMVYTDGKVKRKGKYEYKLNWHQNFSALVVSKVAEAVLVHGVDVREAVINHEDVFDFFLRAKVPRNSTLEWGGERVQNIVRYYISKDGRPLEKVMPPAGPLGEYKRASKLTDQYYTSVMGEIGSSVWDERIHTKNKSKYEERRVGINTGWNVTLCSNLDNYEFVLMRESINYEWYIAEVEKLTKVFLD